MFLGYTYLTRFSKNSFLKHAYPMHSILWLPVALNISEWECNSHYHGQFSKSPFYTRWNKNCNLSDDFFHNNFNFTQLCITFFFVPYRVANHNRRGKKKTCFKRKTSSDKILKWTRSALKRFSKTPGRHTAIYELSHPVGFTVKPTKGGFKFLYHRKVEVVYLTLRNHDKTSNLHPDYFVRVITVYPVQ